jgi:uncharacterized protein (TIGR00297 family)
MVIHRFSQVIHNFIPGEGLLAQLALGLALAALVSAAAWQLKALTRSGALAAFLTGGLVFGMGGLPWAALLLAFFITSSGLSRLFGRRKQAVEANYAKGSQRDGGQVLANGGVGAALALLHGLFPEQGWLWIAFTGTMAAVNADTWATELGVFNPGAPRLITTWKSVEKGASGGVSALGSLAALGGAALIGLSAAAFSPSEQAPALILAASLAGLLGSLVDSLLGAAVQAIYWCPACQKETERHPQHACGSPTTLLRGVKWVNNEVVNFACALAGAGSAALIWSL